MEILKTSKKTKKDRVVKIEKLQCVVCKPKLISIDGNLPHPKQSPSIRHHIFLVQNQKVRPDCLCQLQKHQKSESSSLPLSAIIINMSHT